MCVCVLIFYVHHYTEFLILQRTKQSWRLLLALTSVASEERRPERTWTLSMAMPSRQPNILRASILALALFKMMCPGPRPPHLVGRRAWTMRVRKESPAAALNSLAGGGALSRRRRRAQRAGPRTVGGVQIEVKERVMVRRCELWMGTEWEAKLRAE